MRLKVGEAGPPQGQVSTEKGNSAGKASSQLGEQRNNLIFRESSEEGEEEGKHILFVSGVVWVKCKTVGEKG